MADMLQASTGSDMVKLETMAGGESIPRTKSRTNFPVLVRVTAPPQGPQRRSLDLVAVLDTSGSMLKEGRLDSMKQAMMFVIDNLGSDDRLSIVPFRDTYNHRCLLTEMSEEKREELKTKVNKLQTYGGAKDDVGAANEAAEILEDRSLDERSGRLGRIIYLSGGSDGSDKVKSVNPKFPIYTFGLGTDHSPETLQSISDKTSGVYSYVNKNLDKLKYAFAQSIGGLTSVTAMDLKIEIKTHKGVSISSIESGSYEHIISSGNQVGTIEINDLYAAETKNFIVSLTVPEGKKTVPEGKEELITVGGSYKNGKNDSIPLGESKVVVKRPKVCSTPPDEVVHREVSAELARLQLVKGVFDISKKKELQMLWDGTMKSPNGKNAPEQTMSDLGEAVSVMQEEVEGGRFFMLSWLASQRRQRATTKGSPSKSGDFQTAAMKNMLCTADNKNGYHLEIKDKLETVSKENNVTSSSPVDVSNHPGLSKMEKALEETMLKSIQDAGIASLLNGASVEDMRHAANRYLYLAVVHASILGSRCNSKDDVVTTSQLEAEKKHLLAELQQANTRITELEKQLGQEGLRGKPAL